MTDILLVQLSCCEVWGSAVSSPGGVRGRAPAAKRFCLYLNVPASIGVDLAGLLGGRMTSAESGSVSSGVAYGEGCPLSSRRRGLGSVVSSPSGVRGGALAENAFLAYFEGHRTLIFVPI